MTWTIYNNDRAWGFLSFSEKVTLRKHRGTMTAYDFYLGVWGNACLGEAVADRIYRAAPEPTPTTDPEQTAQHDAATAIGAVGVIGYVMPGDLSRVQAAIKEAQGLINAHMRNTGAK
jgi:hypothetical protein